jgi:threonine dehydrogenase-like Zn-dependent dehydrogenase
VQREGSLTEYIVLPWEKIVKGGNLGLRELAIVEPLAIGIHAGKRCDPKEGDYMLVFGCGMIGIGAIAEGIRAGAKVIAVDVDDSKLEMMRSIGAAFTVNSKKKNLQERVLEITGGHGPAVVLEAIGLPETFVQAVDLAAYSGRVVFVGYAKAPVTFDTKYFILKERSPSAAPGGRAVPTSSRPWRCSGPAPSPWTGSYRPNFPSKRPARHWSSGTPTRERYPG